MTEPTAAPRSDKGDRPRASWEQMRDAWEGFAESDPMYFINADRRRWDAAEFFATGRDQLAEALAWAGTEVPPGAMLDLGCGLGRITVAAADHFQSVVGADISAAMVERARELGPPASVRFTTISDAALREFEDGSFDFVTCFWVFQHIADESVIAGYLAAIGRLLQPAGRTLLHFDTRPDSRLRRVLFSLPDRLLPRSKRRYMRRYPRAADTVRRLTTEAGLTVVKERRADSAGHELLAKRA